MIFYFVIKYNTGADNYELWNKGNVVTTYNNNTVYKTIYSPSPSLFIEPHIAAFTGFTTTGGNTNNVGQFCVSGPFSRGWYLYCQPNSSGSTIFWWATGYRDVFSGRVNNNTGGSLNFILTDGLYWVAGPSTTLQYARFFGFNSGAVYPQNENARCFGFEIQSVYE